MQERLSVSGGVMPLEAGSFFVAFGKKFSGMIA
jgi:hypothetical protein